MTAANIDRDWEERYREGTTPWDSGLPSKELQRILTEQEISDGRALELGCGTGTNAVFLAEQGFDVTAVDCASLALERARTKADDAGVRVRWVEVDVQNPSHHWPQSLRATVSHASPSDSSVLPRSVSSWCT